MGYISMCRCEGYGFQAVYSVYTAESSQNNIWPGRLYGSLGLGHLESLSDRRVGACKRFMATACQMSPQEPSSSLLPLLSLITVQGSNCQDLNMVIPEELTTL